MGTIEKFFIGFLLGFICIGALSRCEGSELCIPKLPYNLAGCGSKAFIAENPKGCWVTWNNNDGTRYLAVGVMKYCNSTSTRKKLADWFMNPTSTSLGFGKNPYTDPELKAVWMYDPKVAKQAGLPTQ